MESNNRPFSDSRMYDVELNGVRFKARRDDRIENYLYMAPHKGKLLPLGVIVNNRLAGLSRRITSDCRADTVDYGSKEGAFIYRRTACLILYAAVRQIDPGLDLVIGQSIRGGYFFEFRDKPADPETVRAIEEKMKAIVADNMRIEMKRMLVDEVTEILESLGYRDKARWVKQIPRGDLWMAELLGFYDIMHGPLAPATGGIMNFVLEPYRHGFVLRFPRRDGSKASTPRTEQVKLFNTFLQTRRENEILGVSNVAELIDVCIRGEIGTLVEASEALFKRRIIEISNEIAARRDEVRLVPIAGPSSSGKTTFSRRLWTFLRILGIKPVTLSIDNYYLDRDRSPRHPDGTYDFESIEALDLPLFNDHIARLIAGGRIESPIFEFTEGKRNPNRTIPIELGPNGMLIIEGIHALNNRLHESVPENKKFRLFASALTQLNIDQHNRIFTSDTRLIRRIVRDRVFRGWNASETLKGWASVRAGEEKWVYPFQESAAAMFNTALVYEHAVLCTYAKRFLLEVPPDDPTFTEASRLFEFVDLFLPVFPEEVPRDSVLREFIGGAMPLR